MTTFKHIVTAAALMLLSISAGACASMDVKALFAGTSLSIQNPINNSRFVDIEAAYGVALVGAKAYIDNYRNGHKCTKAAPESVTNFCSRRSVVLRIQQADLKVRIALGKAKDFIARNPTLDPTSALDAFQTALDTFKAVKQQNGVN